MLSLLATLALTQCAPEVISPPNLAQFKAGGDGAGALCELDVTAAGFDCPSAASVLWYDNGVLGGSVPPDGLFKAKLTYGSHQVCVVPVDPLGEPIPGVPPGCTVMRCTKQCQGLSDCEDSDICTANACIPQADGSSLCKFGGAPFAACCTNDFNCQLGQLCNVSANKCVSCLADADCADANACTKDKCGATGICSFIKDDPLCCDSAAAGLVGQSIAQQCQLPLLSPCMQEVCIESKCSLSKIAPPACCENAAQCQDALFCNVDQCIGNSCKYGPDLTKPGCCDTDADCGYINNPMVSSQCVFNLCTPPFSPSGCLGDCSIGCDDGNPATIDGCFDCQCQFQPKPHYCDTREHMRAGRRPVYGHSVCLRHQDLQVRAGKGLLPRQARVL